MQAGQDGLPPPPRWAGLARLHHARLRLKAVGHNESWPKVILRIFEIQEAAEAFRGIAG